MLWLQTGGHKKALAAGTGTAAKLTSGPLDGGGRSHWTVCPFLMGWSRQAASGGHCNDQHFLLRQSRCRRGAIWRSSARIDKFTEWTGYLFVLSIIPLIFANVIEVFARYVLRAPTIWALDVTTMSYAALFMLGSALALLKGAHVRTDMLWEAFSDRTKGMIDSLAFLLFFLPTMVVLFFISIDDFLYSVSIDERASSGAWTPVLWPLRGVIPLTAFMLFLQGISELMKSLWAWRTGEFLTRHEKIEV